MNARTPSASHELSLTALTEQIADWRTDALTVELEERVVANVVLCGGASKNGYQYSDSALRDAARLYERKPVFLDHAVNVTRPYERSTRDLAGWIAEARYAEGRIVGDVRLVDTEAGRTLLALMSSDTPSVGMSHVILARKSADGALVERIHDVISIDAVVFPAATGGFREQVDDDHGDVATVETSLKEDYETKIAELRDELSRVATERDELRTRCEALVAERDIDRQLAVSGLPEFAITDELRRRLRSTPDAPSRSRLIAEQRDFVLRCRQRAPCSQPRVSRAEDADASLTRRIVEAVKGRG